MFGELTNKEYELMRHIWTGTDGVTFNEIFTHMNQKNPTLKRQTVNTHLVHLIKKGFVRSEGPERKRLYYPMIPQEKYDSFLAEHIVGELFDGSLKKFVSALTTERGLTDLEISEVKSLIRKKGV